MPGLVRHCRYTEGDLGWIAQLVSSIRSTR